MVSIIIIVLIIHPIWLIDEYAIIFRNLTWFTPIIPLIIIDAIITTDMNIVNLILYINRTIGAIFCHVNTNKQFNQSSPSITSGNQKWKGAIPIFVRSLEFIVIINVDWINVLEAILVLFIIMIIDIRIIVDAIACVMKYLIEDSADSIFFWFCIRGIIDKRLISSPSHIPNHEYEEIEIIVLIIKVDMNIIL